MDFKDTNVDQLKLNIASGYICDDSLDKIVVEEGKFTDAFGNDFKVEVAIVGASHSVTVFNAQTNKVVFKEVLANVDLSSVATTDSELTLYKNDVIASSGDVVKNDDFTGINYKFNSETLTIKELSEFRGFVSDSLLHKSTEYDNTPLQDGGAIVLKFVFPSDIESIVEAQTLIKFTCAPDRMLITSYHVYPNNDAAFVSYSEIVTTKKLPISEGLAIVSKEAFLKNMAEAGVSKEKAIEILEKSLPADLFGADEINQIKKEISSIFEAFETAATAAKETIENIDKDEVIENIKSGVSNFLDRFKTK